MRNPIQNVFSPALDYHRTKLNYNRFSRSGVTGGHRYFRIHNISMDGVFSLTMSLLFLLLSAV